MYIKPVYIKGRNQKSSMFYVTKKQIKPLFTFTPRYIRLIMLCAVGVFHNKDRITSKIDLQAIYATLTILI